MHYLIFTCYLFITNRNRKTNNVPSVESGNWVDIQRRIGNMRDEMNYNAAAATRVIFVWTKDVSSETIMVVKKHKSFSQKITSPCEEKTCATSGYSELFPTTFDRMRRNDSLPLNSYKAQCRKHKYLWCGNKSFVICLTNIRPKI